MPQGDSTQALRDNLLAAISAANAVAATGANVSDLLGSLQAAKTAAQAVVSELNACRNAVSPGQVAVAATGTEPTPAGQDQTQVYVSAPAAAGLALVASFLGGAAGYALRGYTDKKKVRGAREAAELTAGEDDEE